MPSGIRTERALKETVAAYLDFDEFVIDVETRGATPEERLDPLRNTVFWISLAGPGRCDVIPCRHPIGERIHYRDDDNEHRIRADGKYQERVYDRSTTGRWVDIPPQFTPAPKQLWVSKVAAGLEPLLFSEQRKIGHHVSFDLRSMAKYYGGKMPPPPYGDTEVAARLVNENYPAYDLKALVSRAFRYKYPKIGKTVEVYPYSEAYSYSYMDARYDWLLWRRLKRLLDKEGMWDLFGLEMELLPILMDMEQTGVHIDTKELKALGREFGIEMAQLKLAIDKAAGHEINLNASTQVAELVYDTLGHTCKEYTEKTEARKTSKDVLEDFIKDPIVAKILDYKALDKLQGTFVEGIGKRITDGAVHPSFQQIGAVSGRMSCKQPNIQQVPARSERSKRIRGIFVAAPKKVLVVADLSQIELRVLAHYTQDPKLLEAYREGLDLHALTAENVFGPNYTPQQRSLAKNGNFSIIFGAGPGTLVRRYGFPSERVARQVLEGFYDTYAEVGPWRSHILRLARKRRTAHDPPYVKTILGRKRRLPELHSKVPKRKYGAERQATSSIISGSAADLFKVGMIDCANALTATGWDAHILMAVHDELVVEVPERYADEGLALVQHSLESVENPFRGGPILSVPLVAEAKVVSRWSDAK